jgi:hypothetical protein
MTTLQERVQAALLAHPEPDGIAAADAFAATLTPAEVAICTRALHAEVARRRTWDDELPEDER